jgi:hypothetical protein
MVDSYRNNSYSAAVVVFCDFQEIYFSIIESNWYWKTVRPAQTADYTVNGKMSKWQLIGKYVDICIIPPSSNSQTYTTMCLFNIEHFIKIYWLTKVDKTVTVDIDKVLELSEQQSMWYTRRNQNDS